MTLGIGNFSPARLQLDLNETRVMAKHGLFWSTCRAYNLLQIHDVSQDGKKDPITPSQWNAVREIEASLVAGYPPAADHNLDAASILSRVPLNET